jgi:hypothetical protein
LGYGEYDIRQRVEVEGEWQQIKIVTNGKEISYITVHHKELKARPAMKL